MRISGILHRKQGAICGFSLLELLLVLAVMSLISGLAIPRTVTMYESFKRNLERNEALLAIGGLGYKACTLGLQFTLDSYPLPADSAFAEIFVMPEGWVIQAVTPVLYHQNGFCDGGNILLTKANIELNLHLKSPFCVPQIYVHDDR